MVAAPQTFPQQRQLGQGGADGPHRFLTPGITELQQLVVGQQWIEDGLIQSRR